MKIAEIVGSYADGSERQIAINNNLFQTIANAFTRSGKVKRPLNQQLPDGQPIAPQIPVSPQATSDENPAAGAVFEPGVHLPGGIGHRSARPTTASNEPSLFGLPDE